MRYRHRRRSGGRGLWSLVLAIGLAVASSYLFKTSERSVSGSATVVDGDTLRLDGKTIRLKGIDTPELKQTCTLQGRSYRCGEIAKAALQNRIAGKSLSCRASGRDRYQRTLAVCEADGQDINAWLVSEGLGVSYGDYRFEETSARLRGVGLWAGEFQYPQDWRREHM